MPTLYHHPLLAPCRKVRLALHEKRIVFAEQVSLIDYIGDVPWDDHPQAKEWYVRLKSRPSFRNLLKDSVPGVPPAPIYADLDF